MQDQYLLFDRNRFLATNSATMEINNLQAPVTAKKDESAIVPIETDFGRTRRIVSGNSAGRSNMKRRLPHTARFWLCGDGMKRS
jgi:hypothetical protein